MLAVTAHPGVRAADPRTQDAVCQLLSALDRYGATVAENLLSDYDALEETESDRERERALRRRGECLLADLKIPAQYAEAVLAAQYGAGKALARFGNEQVAGKALEHALVEAMAACPLIPEVPEENRR